MCRVTVQALAATRPALVSPRPTDTLVKAVSVRNERALVHRSVSGARIDRRFDHTDEVSTTVTVLVQSTNAKEGTFA